MPAIVYAYLDESGRVIEVYGDVKPRRERQLLRKATGRTCGVKTQAAARVGLGCFKGVK